MASTQTDVLLMSLFILWGGITVVLVVLLGYLATLPSQGSQTKVGATQQDLAQQEKALIARGSLLTGEIIVLSVLSAGLLLFCAGSSIYQGFNTF